MEKSKIMITICLSVTIPILIIFIYANLKSFPVVKKKLTNTSNNFILTHGRYYDDIQNDIKELYKKSKKYLKNKEEDISLRETKALLKWNKENEKIWNPIKDFEFNFE
jgi:cell division protein FtsL